MQTRETDTYDNLIIGAGPAGLQLAYLLHRAGRSYVVLEAAKSAGSFFATQPRHRKLLSINKIYNRYPEKDFNLRHDWNSLLSEDDELLFKNYSTELFPNADALVKYLQDFADKSGLVVRYESPVTEVRRVDSGFSVRTHSGQSLMAKRVFVATGAVEENIPAQIEGVELATTYASHSIDKAHYRNKRVAIIGAGNSAFEVADHLADSAAIIHVLVKEPVRHAWQTHFPGDLRAVNNNILDMYQLKSLHATIGFQPKKIVRTAAGALRVSMEEECPHWATPCTINLDLEYDEVIFCTGWNYVPEFFAEDTRPERTACGRYPELSAKWESSVPGLYFIGTSMAARDKRAASSFIHGFRYNVRTLFGLLEAEHEGVPLGESIGQLRSAQDVMNVAARVVDRVSTASGLYQMNAVLADVVQVKAGRARYMQEVPLSLMETEGEFTEADFVMSVSLEYGFSKYPAEAQSINFIHPSDVSRTECSAFLHPVLRLWKQGALVDECHFGESLTIRYDQFFTSNTFVEGYDAIFRRRNEGRVANFLDRELGVLGERLDDERFSNETIQGAFRPWTPEEIQEYQAKQMSMKDMAERPCKP